jgi:hypothetical protein
MADQGASPHLFGSAGTGVNRWGVVWPRYACAPHGYRSQVTSSRRQEQYGRNSGHLAVRDAGAPLGEHWSTREVANFLPIAGSIVRACTTRHEMPDPEAYVGVTKLGRQQTIKVWAAG